MFENIDLRADHAGAHEKRQDKPSANLSGRLYWQPPFEKKYVL